MPRSKIPSRTAIARRLERRVGPARAAALDVAGRVASERGEALWLVGGVVRDLLLGRALGDLDLAVEGDAVSFGRELARRLGASLRAHPAFGTATLEGKAVGRLDLASTRRESYPEPAALPRVEPGRLAEDLARRDFAINAMALGLGGGRAGELVDPYGGLADLRARRVRTLHPGSMRDDPTRAYRAARFAVRLGFRIDRATLGQIEAARAAGLVDRLSGARLAAELALHFAERGWGSLAAALGRRRLLSAVDPCLGDIVEPSARAALDRLERAARREAGSFALPLALLVARREEAARERLAARLGASRAERRILVTSGPAALAALEALGRTSGRLLPSVVHARFARVGVPAALVALAIEGRSRVGRAIGRFLARDRFARPDVEAADLLAAGLEPGPALGRALAAALAAKLDGRAPDRGRQLEAARRAAGLPA